MSADQSKFGARHTLAIMGFLGTTSVYFSRIDLSIAIVAMVGRESSTSRGRSNDTICPRDPDLGLVMANSTVPGEFDWGHGSKGDLLGAYYYGYIVTQIIGAYMASRVGFKITWGIAMLASSILTLLIPITARLGGFGPLLAIRVIIGLFHGVAFPCMHAAWAVWAPPMERSQLVAAHASGASAGTCIIFPLGGLIAATFGWPAVFYFTGAFSFVWSLIWLLVVHDSPEKHPRISRHERDLITREISAYQLGKMDGKSSIADDEDGEGDGSQIEVTVSRNVPWKAMLTSPVVFSVCVAHFTSNWGIYQMNSLLPTYLDSVLQFNVASNGLISSIPFIFQTTVVYVTGWVTDVVRRRKWMQTITLRKINTAVGQIAPGIAVVVAGYMGCNAIGAVAMFTISMGLSGMTVAGSKSSMLDFSPKHSGIVFAISNTFANISGFLAPQLTGHLLDISDSIEQWRLAFWITAAIQLPGAILFLIYGTDKILPWAR